MLNFKNKIIHPILFAIYPVLFLFSINIFEFDPFDLFVPSVMVLGVCLCVWLIAKILFRDRGKAALVTSLSVLMFFLFGEAYRLLITLSGWGSLQRKYFLVVWFLLYLGGVFLILRMKRRISLIYRFANLISVTLIVLACISIAAYYLHPQVHSVNALVTEDLEWIQKWRKSNHKPPQIYYIILDGYGRADKLENHYGFDNRAFLQALKSKGFMVAEKSTSNYSDTDESISSSLNMNYIHDEHYVADRSKMKELIKYNKTAHLFRALGYKYVLVPSGYHVTDQSPLASITVDLGILPKSHLFDLVIETSVVWFAPELVNINSRIPLKKAFQRGQFLGNVGIEDWHSYITKSIEAIGGIAKLQEPTFTFAHIVCPHPPYVFKRDGSLNYSAKITDLHNLNYINNWFLSDQYVDQLVHLNAMLEKMITTILNNSSTPPIIILQGDHGTASLIGKWGKHLPKNPSPQLAKERMSNLFAIYGPDSVLKKIPETITPVNIFRIIFNKCFDSRFPLLPNQNLWSVESPMQDVTHLVNGPTEPHLPDK